MAKKAKMVACKIKPLAALEKSINAAGKWGGGGGGGYLPGHGLLHMKCTRMLVVSEILN